MVLAAGKGLMLDEALSREEWWRGDWDVSFLTDLIF